MTSKRIGISLAITLALAGCASTSGTGQPGAEVVPANVSYSSASEFTNALVAALGGECQGLDIIVQPPVEEDPNPSDVLVYCAPAIGSWNKGQGAVRQNPEEARNLICGGAKENYPKVVGGNWDLTFNPVDAAVAESVANQMGGTVTTIGAFVGC